MNISIVINLDTRPESSSNQKMFSGVVDRDFLIDGVLNKQKLFQGFDFETILFIDEHETLDVETIDKLRVISDTLVIRKHNKSFEYFEDFPAFNDFNYIQALAQARGTYIFHFDGDIAAFAPNQTPIHVMIGWLDKYDYISYPSLFSPNPDVNDRYNYWWVSTRFFCCKRSTIDFTEIIKCQLDYDYMFNKYPASVRNHWLEHVLGVQAKFNGNGVFYPTINYEYFILFTWENYRKGLLNELNNKPYEEVRDYVIKMGGIHYPNNLSV